MMRRLPSSGVAAHASLLACLAAVSSGAVQQPPQAPPATQPPTAADTPVQKTHPVFRKTQPDEQRIEGLLQRIDCSLRGAVAFVLQAGDQTLRLSARKMQDVEFITHRDDLTGDVKCGALKEPMRVYVTSRDPAKPDGPRTVVAVEFLPKDPNP